MIGMMECMSLLLYLSWFRVKWSFWSIAFISLLAPVDGYWSLSLVELISFFFFFILWFVVMLASFSVCGLRAGKKILVGYYAYYRNSWFDLYRYAHFMFKTSLRKKRGRKEDLEMILNLVECSTFNIFQYEDIDFFLNKWWREIPLLIQAKLAYHF